MNIFMRFWIKKENRNFLGSGKIELLEHIKETGSISKAAKLMKMSYKAAWDSIDSMNRLSEYPLVESNSGGKGGGGTAVTPEGKKTILVFRRLEILMGKIETTLGSPQDLENLEKRIILLESRLSDL